jgi:hypothetical protein
MGNLRVNQKEFPKSAAGIKAAAQYIKVCKPAPKRSWDIIKFSTLEEAKNFVKDVNEHNYQSDPRFRRDAFIM